MSCLVLAVFFFFCFLYFQSELEAAVGYHVLYYVLKEVESVRAMPSALEQEPKCDCAVDVWRPETVAENMNCEIFCNVNDYVYTRCGG